MKRVVMAALAAGTLVLGGCSTLSNIGTGISIATASITNPVTKEREAQIELAVDAAVVALKGYKQACAAGQADKSCKANIAAIQRYTVQMPALLVQLRNFVDSNNQINAIVVYNQLMALYTNFKSTAGSLGYNVGAMP